MFYNIRLAKLVIKTTRLYQEKERITNLSERFSIQFRENQITKEIAELFFSGKLLYADMCKLLNILKCGRIDKNEEE